MYPYQHISPISLVDPFGLKPGDPFLTEQDAAIDFGLEYNAESIEKKQEIGALIYTVEINGDTFYTYTEVVYGKEASVNPWRAWNKNSSIKSGDDITAVIHTHANYDIFSDNAFFSYPNDFETRGRNAYLITPYGEMLFHGNDEEYPQNLQDYLQNRQKYFTNLTVEEGIYMPYDPNAPNEGWSAHDKGLNQTRKYNGYSKNFWKFRLAQKRLAEDAKRRYPDVDMSISTGMLIY